MTRAARPVRSASAGNGTVLVATVVGLSLLMAAALALLISCAAGAEKANAAADLVALSGAAAYVSGEGACRGADRAAAANGVQLTGCRASGDILEFVVTVEVTLPIPQALPGLPNQLRASASAGRAAADAPPRE